MTAATRTVAAVILAAVMGSVVTAVVILSLQGDDDDRETSAAAARTTSTTEPDREATGAGAELARLLEAGRKETFHARYQATSSEPGAVGQQVILELWRKPPREREELSQTAGGQTVRTAGFLLPPQSVLCRQPAGAAWSCANSPQGVARDSEGLLRGVTSEVARAAANARDDVVAAAPVRCFMVPTGGQASELCLTLQGITARVSTGTSKVELVHLAFDVPDDVFVPPAPPTG